MNNWRAIGHSVKGEQHLIYIGASAEQVKKNFTGTFYDILTQEEQLLINKVTLEKWMGKANSGNWCLAESLRVPKVYKSFNK